MNIFFPYVTRFEYGTIFFAVYRIIYHVYILLVVFIGSINMLIYRVEL